VADILSQDEIDALLTALSSGETATGKHPFKALETMDTVARRIEKSMKSETTVRVTVSENSKEEIARIMTREMGKILDETKGDVQEGIDTAYYAASEGRRLFGHTVPSELKEKWAMSYRRPIGVCGIITPFNFPMAIPTWKIFPALVCGNSVIFKPAHDVPHTATLLVEILLEAGVHIVALCGGTGEFPFLSEAEKRRVIELGCRHIDGRAKVVAQTSAIRTEDSIEASKHAEGEGADCLLVLPPYFEGPDAEGVLWHYERVAASVSCQVMAYNIPQY